MTANNVFEDQKGLDITLTLEAMMQVFHGAIDNEDYVMGEQQQKAAESRMRYAVIP